MGLNWSAPSTAASVFKSNGAGKNQMSELMVVVDLPWVAIIHHFSDALVDNIEYSSILFFFS